MGCDDVLIIVEGESYGNENGYTYPVNQSRLDKIDELEKLFEADINNYTRIANDKSSGNTQNLISNSVSTGLYNVGMSTDEARKILEGGNKITMIVLGGRAEQLSFMGVSAQGKVGYLQTYIHELTAHGLGMIAGTFSSAAADHSKYFNYNEETKEWYGNHKFDEEDLNKGLSPRDFHESSNAYEINERIRIVLGIGDSLINKSGPVIEEPNGE